MRLGHGEEAQEGHLAYLLLTELFQTLLETDVSSRPLLRMGHRAKASFPFASV